MVPKRTEIGLLTGGNANLLSILGDLVSSDGVQALRVPLGTPGQFLGVDLTAESGLSYQTPGGGGSLTFSDGVTRALDNVTNDLVTGATVDQVNADATDGMTFTSAADVLFDVNSGGFSIDVTGGDVGIRGNGRIDIDNSTGTDVIGIASLGSINLDNGGGPTSDMTFSVGRDETHTIARNFNVAAGTDVTITSDQTSGNTDINGAVVVLHASTALQFSPDNNASITATTGGTGDLVFNLNHDELHTIGRNLSMTVAGSGGATISAAGNIILEAGTDSTGEFRISPTVGAPPVGRTFRIWDGAGASQQDGAISPSGGAVVDTEARAAFNTLLDYLFQWGWVSNPVP